MPRRKHSKSSKKSIWIIIGILVIVLLSFTAYAIGSNKTNHFSQNESTRQGQKKLTKPSTSKKNIPAQASSSISSREPSGIIASFSERNENKTDFFNHVNYNDENDIVAYALSLDSFIRGKGSTTEFNQMLSELDKRGDLATARYYSSVDAYGHLRPQQEIVTMSVKALDGAGTLIFTDKRTGKMAKITLSQIKEDNNVYIESHNLLNK